MTINVYVSREDGHPTKEDTALIKRTKKLVTGLAKEMGLTQSFDVVFFYDSIWLRNFPATKIAAYVSVAKSSKGKRPGLFLRKKYFDETGYEANRLTQVISHELLHMKVGPEKMHGSSFRKAAKEHGITPGATTKVSEMVYKKLTTNQPPQGMTEMYTTPRKEEANLAKSILRKNKIKYRSREEQREHGWRYCIYVPSRSSNRAYRILDEDLAEHGY